MRMRTPHRFDADQNGVISKGEFGDFAKFAFVMSCECPGAVCVCVCACVRDVYNYIYVLCRTECELARFPT